MCLNSPGSFDPPAKVYKTFEFSSRGLITPYLFAELAFGHWETCYNESKLSYELYPDITYPAGFHCYTDLEELLYTFPFDRFDMSIFAIAECYWQDLLATGFQWGCNMIVVKRIKVAKLLPFHIKAKGPKLSKHSLYH